MDESSMLIVGAGGQLGSALSANYPAARTVDSSELDIGKAAQVKDFGWDGIEVIVNAAAFTNVDAAETPDGRAAAWEVNAVGVSNLASAAIKHNLTLIHVSTDYVFDGSQKIHTEDEAFSPLGVYGQTKAAGDIAASMAEKHYLLRTSWVIGDGNNFVRTMLGLGEKGVAPTVVADQIGRLTFTGELVKAIDHLLKTQAAYGTYNLSNGGDPASWADVTREIFSIAGYDLSVTDTTTEAYFSSKPGVAPRPLNSVLSLDKIQAAGFVPTNWQTDLAEYIKENA
jgi:dTDP-4-dehydrorhamnose reductase